MQSEDEESDDDDAHKDVIDTELTHVADVDTATCDASENDVTEKESAGEISRCEDSGMGLSTATHSSATCSTKDMKESVNQASRQSTIVAATQSVPSIPATASPDENPRPDVDTAEYCDAICDVEPIHTVHRAKVQKSRSNPETESSVRPTVVVAETEKATAAPIQRSHPVAHSEGPPGNVISVEGALR